MRRQVTTTLAVLGFALALMLGGCAQPSTTGGDPTPTPPDTAAPGEGAAGTRLAAGYYEQPDGTILAIGTLEWSDLEGGFWAIIGGTESTGDAGKVVAVIPGTSPTDPAYIRLAGKTVQVTGTPIEGASIRNAGPEVKVTSISEMTDTPGAGE